MSDEQEYRFELGRDKQNRLQAQLCEGLKASIKLLAPDHHRRTVHGTHAYVVFELTVGFGAFVRRDIHVQKNKHGEYYLRYPQFKTNRLRSNNKEDWLDIFGPRDQKARELVQEATIALFEEIKFRAEEGDLPASIDKGLHSRPEPAPMPPPSQPSYQEAKVGGMADRPEVKASLERIKEIIEGHSDTETSEETS